MAFNNNGICLLYSYDCHTIKNNQMHKQLIIYDRTLMQAIVRESQEKCNLTLAVSPTCSQHMPSAYYWSHVLLKVICKHFLECNIVN